MLSKSVIGVLALQGAVDPHRLHIEAAGAEFRAVKTPAQFDEVDAFILPGGESTTMLKLIERFDLWDVLAAQFAAKPVWGVCAGVILMAQTVLSPAQRSFDLLPITVERNGYGRQLESCHVEIEGYKVSFIRAPVIKDAAESVHVRAVHKGDPVWLESGQYMLTTFHPEMSLDFPSPMHRAFLARVEKFYAKKAA